MPGDVIPFWQCRFLLSALASPFPTGVYLQPGQRGGGDLKVCSLIVVGGVAGDRRIRRLTWE